MKVVASADACYPMAVAVKHWAGALIIEVAVVVVEFVDAFVVDAAFAGVCVVVVRALKGLGRGRKQRPVVVAWQPWEVYHDEMKSNDYQ